MCLRNSVSDTELPLVQSPWAQLCSCHMYLPGTLSPPSSQLIAGIQMPLEHFALGSHTEVNLLPNSRFNSYCMCSSPLSSPSCDIPLVSLLCHPVCVLSPYPSESQCVLCRPPANHHQPWSSLGHCSYMTTVPKDHCAYLR